MSKKKVSGSAKKQNPIPSWLTEHFEQSLNAHDLLMQIARLSATGIAMHTHRPNVVRVLAKVKGEEESETVKSQLEHAELDAALAQKEIDEGFPVLHGFVTIALWSWMEEFVKGLLALWFLKKPTSLRASAIHKLRVRLGDYVPLSKAEQSLYLVELLEQDVAAPLKQGANRFNTLLEVISVRSDISEQSSKMLYELQKVRNNLAHRGGRADRPLVQDCPWLGLKVNQPLRVSAQMLGAYSNAAAEYLLQTLYSVGDIYGKDLRN